MINQGNDVPDKTIAIFTDPFRTSWQFNNKKRLFNLIDKPSKKRDWFSPHFYRCLPLTIGNQYGFIIKSEFDFSFLWSGEDNPESLKFFFNDLEIEDKHPAIESHFGHGIITINPPFWLRTPPGVNLMTISPPNYIIPNITNMTGVIETDNLNRSFTFNLKVQMPGIQVNIPAGTPLAAFIPIPRYYADSFKLEYAEDIFDESIILEELQISSDTSIQREYVDPSLKNGVNRQYFKGEDVYGNKYSDHQNP
jgi:hypothetical protein